MGLAAPSSRPEQPSRALRSYYDRLLLALGPQGWWPARTRLEVILGAILTQNTAWQNAARALKCLRQAGRLNLPRIQALSKEELEALIRPAGFYRQKALTIRNFLEWLSETGQGSLVGMFRRPPDELRRQLLAVRGLGPETVDAILLYAGRLPFFVADAYTRRILARHDLVRDDIDYASAQHFLHQHLPPDPRLFNEYHALLVEVGKRYCKRSEARCQQCPLRDFLPHPPSVRFPMARLDKTRLANREGASDFHTRREATAVGGAI